MKTQIVGKNLKRRLRSYFSMHDGANKTVIVRGALSILVVLMVFYPLASCVETAECDETVGCSDGKVCYDLKCRNACADDTQCRETESCMPCLENFGAGISDHCFTDSRMACVVQEVEDE